MPQRPAIYGRTVKRELQRWGGARYDGVDGAPGSNAAARYSCLGALGTAAYTDGGSMVWRIMSTLSLNSAGIFPLPSQGITACNARNLYSAPLKGRSNLAADNPVGICIRLYGASGQFEFL